MIVKRFHLVDRSFVFIFILFTIFLLSGIPHIPFHPDEASLLYQSRDFELFFSDPLSLPYQQSREGEAVQTYRVLNPSLPKYILAMGRLVAGYGSESVSVDWNWSFSWEENAELGALPNSELLNASRTASTLLIILSLPILYLCGKRLKNSTLGFFAALLLITHALVLVHGRRAMAEGTLVFGVILAFFGILEGDKRPWLAGIGSAVAACTKMSAGVLVPVGLLAVLWLPSNLKQQKRKIARNVFSFFIAFVLVYLLLTPLLWSNPIQAIQAQWQERTQFLQRMVDEFETLAPNQILDHPMERVGVMISHLFISDPQFAEVGNYLSNTAIAEEHYSSFFYHSLFRGLIGGGLMLTMTLVGVVLFGIEVRRKGWHTERPMILLLIASVIQTLALLWANPLPFQRYYIPLVPFVCLWIGYLIMHVFGKIKQATSTEKQPV